MEVRMYSPNKLEKYKSTKKYKKYISTKVLIAQPFFELLTSGFAWKFIWTVEPNDKVQKYKNTRIQKYKVQNRKVQKHKKCKKCKKMQKCKKNKKYKSPIIKKTLESQLLAQ